MSTTAIVVIVVVAVLVLLAIAAWLVARARRRSALRSQFGPEYDRVVETSDNRRRGEQELVERTNRRRELDIRPLPPAAAARYQDRWVAVQQQFVDAPADAVTEAQTLVTQVMADRGYPTDSYEDREAMLSVDHNDVLDRYRQASDIARASRAGQASTEQLRQAFQHYRALFDRLLDVDDSMGRQAVYPSEEATGEPSSDRITREA